MNEIINRYRTKMIKHVYGFDKYMINEDYSWTYSYNPSHKVGIENDNGPSWTSQANSTRWAKKEVTHSGTTVYYYAWVNSNDVYIMTIPEVSNI